MLLKRTIFLIANRGAFVKFFAIDILFSKNYTESRNQKKLMAQLSNNKLSILGIEEEINLLRSFVIGIVGKDKEGKYKPEFAKKVLKALREKPQHTFKDKNSFLSQIHKENL